MDNSFDVGVVEAAADAGCSAGDNDAERVRSSALAGHGAVCGLGAAGGENFFVSKVVELADCGVAAKMVGEQGCSFGVDACELGKGLFGRRDERVESFVEVG